MTGVLGVLTAYGGLPGGGIGAAVSPAPLSWNDIYGQDAGSTQTSLITGITAPIQLAASKTGGAQLSYVLNGIYATYNGAFTVYPNDALGWSTLSTSTSDQSGVVTVTNVTTGATLDSFDYTIYSSRGVRL